MAAQEKKFHVGVKGIIEDAKGQILLVKEDVSKHSIPVDSYWDLPGGRMNKGENILETLSREIEEETGITEVLDPQFFTAAISHHELKLASGEIVGLVLMVYKIKVRPDVTIKLSREHLDYEWVSRSEAKERLTHKYPKEFIDQL